MKIYNLFLAILWFSVCCAKCEDFSSLVSDSPFSDTVAKEVTNIAKHSRDNKYELRGIFLSGRDSYFNIFASSEGKCKWVKQGDGSSGILIDEFDAKTKTLYFRTSTGEGHSVRLRGLKGGLSEAGVMMR